MNSAYELGLEYAFCKTGIFQPAKLLKRIHSLSPLTKLIGLSVLGAAGGLGVALYKHKRHKAPYTAIGALAGPLFYFSSTHLPEWLERVRKSVATAGGVLGAIGAGHAAKRRRK